MRRRGDIQRRSDMEELLHFKIAFQNNHGGELQGPGFDPKGATQHGRQLDLFRAAGSI